MNEFTKEELEEIQDCLPFSCHPKMGFANKLFDKIESMIDNYCEHEWENHCHGCVMESVICNKCEAVF